MIGSVTLSVTGPVLISPVLAFRSFFLPACAETKIVPGYSSLYLQPARRNHRRSFGLIRAVGGHFFLRERKAGRQEKAQQEKTYACKHGENFPKCGLE